MGIFSVMKSRMLAALAKVAAVIATTGKNAGIDIKTVTDSINAQPYIYVGRGKGGKKQAHRQTGAAAIKRAAKKARNRKRSK